ncbi:MAG: cbb3-type cytochrome c oxidase subunit I [Bacteroidia bacterium]|nr:cbb3-type cytochrome c oxidase subunit I [Bacteroidia bacterium]MDW8346093.1 cbb3-type cytochrome c oxidase subunit I [Bacteroidia bacterium]
MSTIKAFIKADTKEQKPFVGGSLSGLFTDMPPVKLIDTPVVVAFIVTAAVWLGFVQAAGWFLAMKFHAPWFGHSMWTHFGRFRAVHTSGMALAGFGTFLMGLSYYMVPKLTGRRMAFGPKMGWAIYGLWNLSLIVGFISVMIGDNQGIEVADLGPYASIPLFIAFAMFATTVLTTIITRKEQKMYVTLWYLTVCVIWASMNLILGYVIIPNFTTGVDNMNLHGAYLHYTVGLLITPGGIAIIYYFLPLAAQRPLYSHKLSLIGFWTIALVYPFVGAHHYLYAPLPKWVQDIAIATSWLLMVPVLTVTQNFYGTMTGNWKRFNQNHGVRFLLLGAFWYFLGSLQGSLESFRAVQDLTHFTDFVVGHAHMATYGAFILFISAGGYYVIPRVTGRRLYSKALADWHWWLTVIGLTGMLAVLTFQGPLQGQMWASGIDFVDSMAAMVPFWEMRTFFGWLSDVSQILYAINIILTIVKGQKVPNATDDFIEPKQRTKEIEELLELKQTVQR